MFETIGNFLSVFYSGAFKDALGIMLRLYPFWLPIMSAIVMWDLWLAYVRRSFLASQENVILEIRIPKDIFKSPAAMEIAVGALWQIGGESNFIDRYWHGKSRAWFSLEIASIAGQVRFFVWTRKGFKNLIESSIYGQYPNVEIYEVPDYTLYAEYDSGKTEVFGCEFALTKADPIPIKTYIDYGLDKDPKEEYKIDPITAVLEFLGSIGQGQQMWLQIMVRAHKKERHKAGTWFQKVDWTEEAKTQIEKIRKDLEKKEGGFPRPMTRGEADTVAAIERSIGKLAFDTGIRAIYYADEKDKFNGSYISGLLGMMKPFSSNYFNGFKPVQITGFDYPWQDFQKLRLKNVKRKLLDAYKRRAYFHPPHKHKAFVLSAEELATIYHFPGQVAATPTFTRIPSKKSEPPSNLPI